MSTLDAASARALLTSLGVQRRRQRRWTRRRAAGGHHAKAVELLGAYLVRYHDGDASRARLTCRNHRPRRAQARKKPAWRGCWRRGNGRLPAEAQDVIGLATAFRDPPIEDRLKEYLVSAPVQTLLHETWRRTVRAVRALGRPIGWRSNSTIWFICDCWSASAGTARRRPATAPVIDAHPLVRRAFEHVLGATGRREGARARAGFLRGRPDRRRPATLEQAREEVEMFHAYCDAGLWNEADSAYVALDNPKHRFLAPALERDLLLRFFPAGDWRRPPFWSGFGRWRSLAICLEMLGQFEDALAVYREKDAALRGDALIALGRLDPLLDQPQAQHPWQNLWQAYRCHALCLAGRTEEAVALAQTLVPVDVYEWVHVFECLLRAGKLSVLDIKSVLFRPPHTRGTPLGGAGAAAA